MGLQLKLMTWWLVFYINLKHCCYNPSSCQLFQEKFNTKDYYLLFKQHLVIFVLQFLIVEFDNVQDSIKFKGTYYFKMLALFSWLLITNYTFFSILVYRKKLLSILLFLYTKKTYKNNTGDNDFENKPKYFNIIKFNLWWKYIFYHDYRCQRMFMKQNLAYPRQWVRT